MQNSKLRNVAFIAQVGAGKTRLLDSLLLETHAVKPHPRERSVVRTEPEEVAHGIAVTSHLGHFVWKDVDVTFVDAPGGLSFLEANRGVLPGVDGVVFLVSALEPLKAEAARLWQLLADEGIPTLTFLNKLDEPEADYLNSIKLLQEQLKGRFLPINVPSLKSGKLAEIVSLLDQSWTQAPEALQGDLAILRGNLLEAIVEGDDTLLEEYLEGREPSPEALVQALKTAVIGRSLFPVLCGSADAGLGQEALLDAILQLLPSPQERLQSRMPRAVRPEGEVVEPNLAPEDGLLAQVLKTTVDRFSGKLSVIRLHQGSLRHNQYLLNSSQGVKQRAGHVFRLQGRELEQVDQLLAGQIGAVAKLEETHTGETLCAETETCIFASVHYAEPVVAYAVEAVDAKQQDKLVAGLQRLVEEDPTLHIHRDEQTHEVILSGMGQTHLDIALERLTRKYGSQARLRQPAIPYRETIAGKARCQGRIKKQTGGHGQFANCWLEIEPLARGAGFEFLDEIVGGVIPRQYIPSVRKGVQEAMLKGCLKGYPVTDVRVRLVDGSFHDVDSSDYAFQAAGAQAFRDALKQADPVLLEPIMHMDVEIPESLTGEILKDLNTRRARILQLHSREGAQVIECEVPMAEVLEYGNVLTAQSSGQGTYHMHVAYYKEAAATAAHA
ncbi:elongation factor G [bacterium]|nr:elongation factor G [bacterium]